MTMHVNMEPPSSHGNLYRRFRIIQTTDKVIQPAVYSGDALVIMLSKESRCGWWTKHQVDNVRPLSGW